MDTCATSLSLHLTPKQGIHGVSEEESEGSSIHCVPLHTHSQGKKEGQAREGGAREGMYRDSVGVQ